MPSRPLAPNHSHPTPTSITKPTILFLTLSISASVVIFLTILYFLYYLWSSLVNRSRTIPFDSGAPLKLQKFTYKELKAATNEFDEGNIIGKGGSGTVFRGIAKDGKLYAVKRLDNVSLQSEKEFQNELQVLGGLKPSPFLVTLLGYSVEKKRRLLVYEYMPNKSLQELLFGDGSFSLSWERRFSIVKDVGRALEFLHIGCDPPVIHGDIKPSNVLLDFDFRAKVSDFGLSRVKVEGEFGGVDLFSPDLEKSQELSGNLASETNTNTNTNTNNNTSPAIGTPVESNNEVDFALALQLQASSSLKYGNRACYGTVNTWNCVNAGNNYGQNCDVKRGNGKGKEVSSVGDSWSCKFVPCEDEFSSKEFNCNGVVVDEETRNKQWGKDWWWRQDGSGELSSKDYVMEWIGSQISPSTNPDWDDEKMNGTPERTELHVSTNFDKLEDADDPGFREFRCERKEGRGRKHIRKKNRKMQEWWKEEHLDELSKKGSLKQGSQESRFKKRFKIPHFDVGRRFRLLRKGSREGKENDLDQNGEFSFRRGWKKNRNARSMGSDMWSGDVLSRELSSTTSMRGTLCYVAPEYGGCGFLMEKADIYSLGVLILVIVSGRRPLHVLASPMKLEKANLVSWCRQLAQSGNILELMDEKLKDDYNKEQASLCINLALACLQKMPELRPDIAEIVKILNGEMDLPPLPFEFSPSPPSKLFSRSRRKQKASAE